jgi:hypothetical protein
METERRPQGDGALPRSADGAEALRRRRLIRLGADVARLQGRLGAVQTELRALRALEATRPLTGDEARQVGRLRLESQGLRLELNVLSEAFERLRRTGPSGRR